MESAENEHKKWIEKKDLFHGFLASRPAGIRVSPDGFSDIPQAHTPSSV